MDASASTLDVALKVGEIIAIVGSVGIGLFTVGRSTSRVELSLLNQAKDIAGMQAEIKKLSEIIVLQAIQTTKLDSLNDNYILLHRTVEDLRRGNGWITKRPGERKPGIDGEYP